MNSRFDGYTPLDVAEVKVRDAFWSRYIELIYQHSIPFLWDALNDNIPSAEKSHAIENYKIAAGTAKGEFYGPVFQDSDVTKWLEGAALYLMHRRDEQLETLLDQVVDIIVSAQQPDGYLDTYYTIKDPAGRWKNLQEGHELYCAGHLIEAAVAYYKATGKRKLLDCACRFADLIAQVFGTGVDQIRGYAGHPEVELALVKLYDATGEERYLECARYFVDQRGESPYYFDIEARARGNRYIYESTRTFGPGYAQAHRPVREQEDAQGHAVRAMYLYAGMADVAMHTRDEGLMRALKRLWSNVVARKMYVTGAIGSSEFGEAFSGDDDLPNDRAYAETCASIGLMMFAQRMLECELDAQYADVMELALCNAVLGGMALDGRAFFYVNPLEVYPEFCSRKDTQHVLPERKKWFACSCCPPNTIRTILSIGNYAYAKSEDALNIHLYVSGELSARLGDAQVRVKSDSTYYVDGKTRYTLSMQRPAAFSVNVRLPGWSARTTVSLNGERVSAADVSKGYLCIRRRFSDGDTIDVQVDMAVRLCRANARVRHDAGKVAVRRGPFIYCAESADNGPGLHLLQIVANGKIDTVHDCPWLLGMPMIRLQGVRRCPKDGAEGTAYSLDEEAAAQSTEILMIPYYAWANRGRNEMRVWIDEA